MPQDIIFSIDHTDINTEKQDGSFVSDNMHYTDIEDATEISTRAFNKMTTSIPTPFARLYLYEGAFKTLVEKETKDEGGMNPYKGKALHGKTINHYVVADALDMLEFLFEYGNDPCLKIEKWTRDDLELLKTELDPNPNQQDVSVEEKHNLLYESIKSNTTDGKLGTEFYIFKWCYQKENHNLEEVIGATSPLTLVYTAPNWRTNKPQRFYGGKGNELFVKDLSTNVNPVALASRSAAFRQYLYALLVNHSKNTPFFDYIKLTRENYETSEGLKLDEFENFATDPIYSSVNDANGMSISVTDVPFKLRNKGALDEACEFVIKPTVSVLDEYNSNAERVELSNKLPLVLSSKGIVGNEKPHYWYESQFTRNNAELQTPNEKPYFERTLPNVSGMVVYPNLRAEDFFEDKIVKLSYNLDSRHFITGMEGNCQYLLPIKPTFFKFFKAEDLKNKLTIVPQSNGSVKATLTIPVRGKKTPNGYAGANVVFEKVYANNEQTQVRQIVVANRFNLALFPFYRLEKEDSQYNCYEVMLGHDGTTELEFYNEDINNLSNEKRKEYGRSSVKVRSVRTRTIDTDPTFGITTTYYHLGDNGSKDGSFQFIVAKFSNSANALIVPDWSTGKTKLGNSQYVVSVDFGTTNTHIAYAQIDEDNNKGVLTDTIKDMEYNRGSQVVTLNEYGSLGIFAQFGVYMQREFVPIEICDEAKVKFPIGTLIYEKNGQRSVNDLFGDMNIAFELNEEDSRGLGNGELKSNIKWSEDPNTKNRIEAFFTEIMWMVKNKIVEVGGRMDFKFIFTFPQSMKGDVQGYMADYWKDARTEVRAGNPDLNNWNKSIKSPRTNRSLMPYEGLAPWYSSLKHFGPMKSFLNIDIGGGTFDVIAVQPTQDKVSPGLSFSAQFAANELWGEGQRNEDVPENGFYSYYRTTQYCSIFMERDKGFSNYYNPKDPEATGIKPPKPSEIIPYLFKHDRRESEFSSAIRENKKLRSLVLLHFTSIVYYVGRVLLLTETNCPQIIQLTGMGSLYINLITDNDETLTELVKGILKYAAGDSIQIPEDFQVCFKQLEEHPKKITAQGALVMWNTTMRDTTTQIINSRDVVIYGFEGDEDDPVELKDNQVGGQKDSVMKRIEHLLGIFNDASFSKVISEIGITDVAHLKYDEIKNVLIESFNQMSLKNNVTANGSVSKEAIFFWPLKDGIHKLAIKYAK